MKKNCPDPVLFIKNLRIYFKKEDEKWIHEDGAAR